MRSALARMATTVARSPTFSQHSRRTPIQAARQRGYAAEPAREPVGETLRTENSKAAEKAKQSEGAEGHTAGQQVTTNPPSTTTTASTTESAKIPDVPSTSWSSIGFEPEDAKDPNKWKKFAWKYAGAVLLFMISYKTLHWYVDRLEADGKKRREELEENKRAAEEMREKEATPPINNFQFLDQLPKSDLPEQSSELDELYKYKIELEQRLKDLASQPRSPERDANRKEARSELKDIANEIRGLEARKSQ